MSGLIRGLCLAVCIGMACASGSVQASDLPVKAAPVTPLVYNWSGFYAGVHAGYGMGMKDWTNSLFDFDARGFLGGGQVGVNQQIGNWVIGIEADASWANIKGSQTLAEGGAIAGIISNRSGSSSVERLVTVAGRIGFAQDRWLVYFKGGAAWVHENHAFSGVQAFIPFFGPVLPATTVLGGRETRFGPMIGFGSEYALWGNWSFKSEYNYLYLPDGAARLTGTQAFAGVTTSATADIRIQQAFHLVKFGVNYRVGPEAPPVIAPARPAPGFNWTGFYVGAEGGYGFSHTDWEGRIPDTRLSGGLAGGVAGTNVQLGVFVFGIESEWMWSGVKGAARNFQNLSGGPTLVSSSNNVDWLSLSSLRAGFVAADRWLVYFKGGVALAHETHGSVATQSLVGFGGGTDSFNITGSALHTGYLAGFGVEHAFFGNWSAKIEYNYIHFRPQAFTGVGPEVVNVPPLFVGTNAIATRATVLQEMHLIKFGVNYHFNALPYLLGAKY